MHEGRREVSIAGQVIALVTGAAGFIGSHLCEHLLAAGDDVRGVDAFTDYYVRGLKEENISGLLGRSGLTFVEGDLNIMPLMPLLDDVRVVYHLAGQPGVRPSWGEDFEVYVRRNVLATQRLLEACRLGGSPKVVYASSSSIYGEAPSYPTPESATPHPISPYGVTKLAGEHLNEVYRRAFGVPTASLRLFTVYGPRQRPDMAFSRLIGCAVERRAFELYGDGAQTRDFTFVGDVVAAMRNAAMSEWVGVANIGGGVRVSMNEVVEVVRSMCGHLDVVHLPSPLGDVRHTGADTRVAAAAFGYRPETTLVDGVRAMVDAVRSRNLGIT